MVSIIKHVYCVYSFVYIDVNVEDGLNIRLYYKRSAVVGAFRGGPPNGLRDVVYSG